MTHQRQSTLQNVYSKSFPANNLFEASLVKDGDPDLPFYKPRFFMFLSLTPGGQTEQGGRTFNRDGRITLKADYEKVMALANSIRAFARGQGQALGQFAIFADSSKSGFGGGGGIKSCFVGEFAQKSQQGGQDKRMVALSFKSGQNKPLGLFWSPSEAMAVADVLDFLANKGLELDFDSRQNSVGQPRQSGGGQRQSPPAQSQPQYTQQHQQAPQNNASQGVIDNFGNAMTQNTNHAPTIEYPPF